jgi:hypothetical protein
MEGKMLSVRGNVLEPQRINRDEFVVIPHCCNDIGVMGAGVALSIKSKWPGAVDNYFLSHSFKKSGGTGGLILGEVYMGPIDNTMAIANMIGQHGVRSEDNLRPVKYVALMKAMTDICEWLKTPYAEGKKIVFHCPKFGSDLAGGDWKLILHLIREIWVEKGFDVVIYEWEQDPEKWGPIGKISEKAYMDGDNDYVPVMPSYDIQMPDCINPDAENQFIPD